MTLEIDLHIGRRLRRRRRLLGLTQQQLARAVGVRFQQIQKYECAANAISAARLFDLARSLEVDIRYFYEGFEVRGPWAAGAPVKPDDDRTFAPRPDAPQQSAAAI